MSLNVSEMFGICIKICCIILKVNKFFLIEVLRCFFESVFNFRISKMIFINIIRWFFLGRFIFIIFILICLFEYI